MKTSLTFHGGGCENEVSRRLYRGAVEAAQRLEYQLCHVSSFAELFSNEVTSLRMRLKDYCERLMFSDPIEYGRKSEELLWRKVYYEFIQKCKQKRKKLQETPAHQYELQCHLLAGIGAYHHMLLRLQTEFHMDLDGKVNVPFKWHLRGVKKERWKKYQQSLEVDDNIQMWAKQASHRILIYLGDLVRYIAELHEPECCHLAERYYHQAFCIHHKNGTPHNQLGSLANSGFEAAYHYMRCLVSHNKFDGAEGNLVRVFEKNSQALTKFDSSNGSLDISFKSARFLTRFLKLCEIFFFTKEENSQLYCQETLQDFDSCMLVNLSSEYGYDMDNFSHSFYLEDDTIFKVVVMSMICMTRLHQKGSSDFSAATAFTLALFSHIVHYTSKRLASVVYEAKGQKVKNNLENLAENQSPNSLAINFSPEQADYKTVENDSNKENSNKKMGQKRAGWRKISVSHLRMLRRRRKMSSTSQEDSELSEGEIMELPESDGEDNGLVNSDISQTGSCSSESLSEHEEEEEDYFLIEQNNLSNTSCVTPSCRDFSSDCSENSSDIQSKTLLLKDETETDCQKQSQYISAIDLQKEYVSNDNKTEENLEKEMMSNVQDNCNSFILRLEETEGILLPPEKLINVLKKIGLLPCLKILADWLGSHSEILSACAESSQFLLSRIVELLNLLLKIEVKLLSYSENAAKKFKELQRTGEHWKQLYPLPEDTTLQHLSALEKVHSHLSFEICKRRILSPSEQVFLRIQCLLSFGSCLTQSTDSLLVFDKESNEYSVHLCKEVNVSSNITSSNQDVISRDMEGQRQHLMRSMAHLWLKAEVNDLELLVEGSSQLSPYLVTDTSALCYYLPLLKQLIVAKRFIIVVPSIVIANLDHLKKESLGAREAIRWLEMELRKGCRYIRSQRQMERLTLVPVKYPKKKEKEAWDFFQILECCHYLSQQQQQPRRKSSWPLVTLVVGTNHQLPNNAAALSQSIGVTIESVEFFFSKWRNSLKNPG